MSLPTKVLNTHRKSLNLVDNPHFFETKVSCGNFYAVCVFRTQYCGLSCVSQPNPVLILIFLHRQAVLPEAPDSYSLVLELIFFFFGCVRVFWLNKQYQMGFFLIECAKEKI